MHSKGLAYTAKDCIQCGKCEPNCSFGVAIRVNMKQAQALFESKR